MPQSDGDRYLREVRLRIKEERRRVCCRPFDRRADITLALQKIVAELNPQHPDPDLDASLKSIEQQMASEGVTRTQFLRIGYLAKQVGLKDEYENLNLVCSKFVHPTAWSLFAFDELPSKLPASGEILFAYGAKYLATVHAEIRPHVKKYGFRHKA